MEQLIRYLPLPLAALFGFFVEFEFFENVIGGMPWKFVGLLVPALWLAATGPRSLLRSGGIVMRLLGIKATREHIALMGLVWLIIGVLAAWFLERRFVDSAIIQCVCLAIAYAGLMSCLGVFLLLSLSPESPIRPPKHD